MHGLGVGVHSWCAAVSSFDEIRFSEVKALSDINFRVLVSSTSSTRLGLNCTGNVAIQAVCMSTPGHTYTGTCVCDMYVCVCVCIHWAIRTQAHVCVCACPCDPLETKFTRSDHFLHRTAHTVPEAEERETQSCFLGGGEGGNIYRYASIIVALKLREGGAAGAQPFIHIFIYTRTNCVCMETPHGWHREL